MKKLRWLAILMGITILGITGFQGYWLNDNYEREKQNLEIKTSADFHQTVLHLQASKLNLEKLSLQLDSLPGRVKANVVVQPGKRPKMQDTIPALSKAPPITMINLLQEKIKEAGGDTAKARAYIFSGKDGFIQNISSDSLAEFHHGKFNTKIESIAISSDSFPNPEMIREIKMDKEKNAGKVITLTYGAKNDNKDKHDSLLLKPENYFVERHGPVMTSEEDVFDRGISADMKQKNAVFRFLYTVDSVSLKDSVRVKEITEAYTAKLKEEKMKGLAFAVGRSDSSYANSNDPHDVTIGFAKPITYHLSIENKVGYLLKKLTLPILFSIFLVGITVI
jgi:hypothetical protein